MALVTASIVVLALVYYFVDPAGRWMPKCPVYTITGLKCPGCGTQRALHSLLHGDIADAWRFNAGLLVCVPLLILLWTAWLMRNRWTRLYRFLHSSPVILGIGFLLLLWGILRNIL